MPVSRLYKVASPFNAAELYELDYEQTADLLYYAHENHKPAKLTRAGHTNWTFSDVAFSPLISAPASVSLTTVKPNVDAANSGNSYFPQSASYVVTAYNEVTGQESRASAAVTGTNDLGLKRNYNSISWTAVTGATSYRIYKRDNTQAYGYIGSTDTTSFRDDNIGPDLSEGPPVGDNPFAAEGDYPGAVTFHEQRSIWGRSRNRPNGIWGSRSADYENMDFRRPLREDDAFALGLVANKVNAVNQLVSSKRGLFALTSNNIFGVTGSGTDYLATVPPPRSVPEISRGSSRLNPITIDSVVFYETAKGSEIHTLNYQYEIEGQRTSDITIFSRHLFKNLDIIDWSHVEKPHSTIITIRDDGKAAVLTWDQAQDVFGWTLWETDGLFKGVCSIYEGGEDRAYFLIERTINGLTKLFVERLASSLWEDQANACYLDCAKSFFFDTPTASLTGLDHLEGESVYAFADGNVIRNLTVTNGAVTLPYAAVTIHIGLPFTATIQTLPLAMQTREGWNIAKPQNIGDVVVRAIDTRGILVGSSEDQLFSPKERDTENYNSPDDLYTGDYEASTAGVSGNEVTLWIKSMDPLPCTVSAVLIEPQSGASS
jgi:hypothetical protein